ELKSISDKLDQIMEATKPVGAASEDMHNVQPDAAAVKSIGYTTDLFPGFRSDELAELQKGLLSGDKTARHRLERYRLESQSIPDRLVALMVEVEHDRAELNF